MVHGDALSPKSQRSSIEDTSPRTSRKVSTYGGSRAWSEQEEAYLLEARQCKTPYKQIASHLQKTELACRLHFHQLAYGTKRKRRSPSTTSTASNQESRNPSIQAADRCHASQRSIDSTGSRATDPNIVTKVVAPTFSPPSSPPPAQRRRLARSESPIHDDALRVPITTVQPATSAIPATSTFSPFPGPQSPFPSLPHLNAGHLSHPLISPSAMSCTSTPSLCPPRQSSQSLSPYPPQFTEFDALPAPRPGSALFQPHLLNHSGSNSAPPSLPTGENRAPSPHNIDPYRLSGIYSRNRQAFWVSIAREYGGNVSPTALEAAFLRQSAGSPTGSSLPTPPNRSPVLGVEILGSNLENGEEGERRKGDRRGSNGAESAGGSGSAGGPSCSIASLLTEDREVWQRRRTA